MVCFRLTAFSHTSFSKEYQDTFSLILLMRLVNFILSSFTVQQIRILTIEQLNGQPIKGSFKLGSEDFQPSLSHQMVTDDNKVNLEIFGKANTLPIKKKSSYFLYSKILYFLKLTKSFPTL